MKRTWGGRLAAAALLLAVMASPAFASLAAKDGSGAAVTLCSVDVGGIKTPCHTTPDGSQTGTLNAASSGASYQMTLGQGQGSMVVYVAGLTASGATLTFKATVDGTNYAAINRPDGATGIPASTITADGKYTIPIHGESAAGLFVTTPGTGTITIASASSIAFSGDVRLQTPLPPGSNTIGATVAAVSSVTGQSSAVTVGTSSALALAAGARRKLTIDNESPTATVACAFGATAGINAAGSYTIPPLNTRKWTDYPVPADAVNCIADTASTPVTIEAN